MCHKSRGKVCVARQEIVARSAKELPPPSCERRLFQSLPNGQGQTSQSSCLRITTLSNRIGHTIMCFKVLFPKENRKNLLINGARVQIYHSS